MAVNFRIQTQGLNRMLKVLEKLPDKMAKSTARAMTVAGKYAVEEVKRATPRYVDRPTKYTLNAWGRWPGFVDKNRLQLWIGPKTTGGRESYLRPMIFGGDRPLKRSEIRLLERKAIVPTGLSPVRLNRYGNVPGGTWTKVVSQLKGFNAAGFTANASDSARSKAKRRSVAFFVAPLRDGRQAIYGRSGRNARPVFIFQRDRPNYERQFPADDIIGKAFGKSYKENLKRFLLTS